MKEKQYTQTIKPDTPQNRQMIQAIREAIELYGWNEFERLFVEATGLELIQEEAGKRYYERPDGEARVTFTVGDEK